MPDALAGRDVLGRGQTGSGKTLAFGLPMIARLASRNRARPLRPRALILVPTRELAMQVNDALVPLGKSVGIFLKTAVGGVPYDRQIDALRRGVEIIVATPGRLGDLIERGVCQLDDVEVTVLDEADQMADMGFLPEVTELLAKTPADGQRLLFSATLDGDVDALVKRFMTDPVTHSTAPSTASVSTMDHHMLLIPPHDKFPVAASIAARDGRTMVFARTQLGRGPAGRAARGRRRTRRWAARRQDPADAHQDAGRVPEGRMNVLVATDVAARGIHVDGVTLVLHVDPPKDPKDYLHRAGRTARAGESGAVATLVLPKQRRTTLAMMEKAGVAPAETRVRVGDAALAELTGAREPSGVPVRVEPEPRATATAPAARAGSTTAPAARAGSVTAPGRAPLRRPPAGERRYGDRPTGERVRRPPAGRPVRRPAGERRYGDRPQGERRYGDRPTASAATATGRRASGATATAPAASGATATGRSGERGSATAAGRAALRRPGQPGSSDRPQRRPAVGDRPQFGDRRRPSTATARPASGASATATLAVASARRAGRDDRPRDDRPREDRPRDDRRGFGGRPPARTH